MFASYCSVSFNFMLWHTLSLNLRIVCKCITQSINNFFFLRSKIDGSVHLNELLASLKLYLGLQTSELTFWLYGYGPIWKNGKIDATSPMDDPTHIW